MSNHHNFEKFVKPILTGIFETVLFVIFLAGLMLHRHR